MTPLWEWNKKIRYESCYSGISTCTKHYCHHISRETEHSLLLLICLQRFVSGVYHYNNIGECWFISRSYCYRDCTEYLVTDMVCTHLNYYRWEYYLGFGVFTIVLRCHYFMYNPTCFRFFISNWRTQPEVIFIRL